MAALYGIERVLDQALAALKAGMGTKLDALETEYGDSLVLAEPSTSTGYWCHVRPPDPANVEDWGDLTQPSILLWPAQDALTATSSPNPNIANEYAVSTDLIVAVAVRADTQAQSDDRQMRYVRAVKEVLCASSALACGQCLWSGTDWRQRDIVPSEADYTLQAVVSAFTVITFEQA